MRLLSAPSAVLALGSLLGCARPPAPASPCPPSSAHASATEPAASPSAAEPNPLAPNAPGAVSTETGPKPIAPEPATNAAPRPEEVSAFNAWLASLGPNVPLQLVAARAFPTTEAQKVSLVIEYAKGEAPRSAVLTVTLDGLLDDSVRGEEHVLRLERAADGGPFRLISSERRVRCWPGRGHADFAVTPCT